MEKTIHPTSDTPLTSPATPGVADEVDMTGQVLGEFRLLHCLGRGGMGQVYLAEQTSLKRKVALKLLRTDMAANERSLLRFKAEAENVARATHANIVQIYTIGETNGINYIALEYVDGKNLREFLEKKGTPELSLGLHIMAQVAAALQRAAELGVIHRDVKPENIMLTKKGEVKVADFGLSRCFDDANPQNLTQSQVVMGTPLYMSPEQIERGAVDSRADIYSFGVTCYHMFAGNPPFRGNSPIDIAYQHVHKEPPLLSEIRPDLPTELCWMIHKMMAKKPEDRYQTAREIQRDVTLLRESLNLGAIAAISISSTSLGSTSDKLGAVAPTPPLQEPGYYSRRLLAAMIGSILLSLGGGLFLGWYQQEYYAGHRDPVPGPGHPEEKIAQAKALATFAEREKELRKNMQKYFQPELEWDVISGLHHAIDLTRFYLQERKYDEAEEFFKELSDPGRKIAAYYFLARLGRASALAFRDEYAKSNEEFVAIAGEIEKLERNYKPNRPPAPRKDVMVLEDKEFELLWKKAPALRETVALALEHNLANAPDQFPLNKLDVFRLPPQPTLRPPPPP